MAAELLQELELQVDALTVIPSDGGRFELTVNGELLFSKLQQHRHAEPGEILKLVRKYLQEHE